MIPQGILDAVNAVRGVRQKTISPLSPNTQAENERQLKRQNYIREGSTFSHMTPYEEQIVGGRKAKPVRPNPTVTPAPVQTLPTPPKKVQEQLNPQHMQFLETTIFPITRQYNIPDAVAASQWAMEGGRTYSNPQNNVWGLGGTNLIQYPSLEASTKDYALTVQNILKQKGVNVKYTDAFKVLMKLQEGDKPRYEAHNPDPMTYVNDLINTPEFRSYYK